MPTYPEGRGSHVRDATGACRGGTGREDLPPSAGRRTSPGVGPWSMSRSLPGKEGPESIQVVEQHVQSEGSMGDGDE